MSNTSGSRAGGGGDEEGRGKPLLFHFDKNTKCCQKGMCPKLSSVLGE